MDASLMLPTIPETDLDGANIQAKMLNFLRHLVVEEEEKKGTPKLLVSEDLDDGYFHYRTQAIKMIQNNKTTLEVNYSHLIYADPGLSEVVYFYYYKVG